MLCATVVMFCHSERAVFARFLFHAQDSNMTNGDFAFFTFRAMQSRLTDRPWNIYVDDPQDLPRRQQAFYAVKQVRASVPYCHHNNVRLSVCSHKSANSRVYTATLNIPQLAISQYGADLTTKRHFRFFVCTSNIRTTRYYPPHGVWTVIHLW